MKILYGVQGTGNGHLTRARSMAAALEKSDLQVDWLFTGRPAEKYFDMECFGDYQTRAGLTYVTHNGKIDAIATAKNLGFGRFVKEVKSLDLSNYDLVISDFEPVSAWAARRAGRMTLGISHQAAFQYNIPKKGNNWFTDQIMKWFAPVDISLGVHWHHFNGNILPPLIQKPDTSGSPIVDNHYLVYFPFQSLDFLIDLVEPFKDHHFFIYHDVPESLDIGHIHIRPFSKTGFREDLVRSAGVICGAGFGLASECISIGKKLLVQPVEGQMEQLSNGQALRELQLGSVCDRFSHEALGDWLKNGRPCYVDYPDVASEIVASLESGDFTNPQTLVTKLWKNIQNSPSDAMKSIAASTT